MSQRSVQGLYNWMVKALSEFDTCDYYSDSETEDEDEQGPWEKHLERLGEDGKLDEDEIGKRPLYHFTILGMVMREIGIYVS